MSEQILDQNQAESAECVAQTEGKPQSKWRDFFWTLPQPILILGSMFAVATAFVYEWTDPELYSLIMILLPLPLILIAERIWVKRPDWILTPKESGCRSISIITQRQFPRGSKHCETCRC
jgi:hypothetical protein